MTTHPPVRQMIREAVEALGSPTTTAAVRDWIGTHYPGTNPGTIKAHITLCTVNQQARVNWPENRRPRAADDPRYDFLYAVGRGKRVVYDPEVHGTWRIARLPDGSLVVCRDDEVPVVELPDRPAVPVGVSQVDAAAKLMQYCPIWRASEEAFARLRTEMPEFDLRTVMVKAAVINDLYSTRVYAIWRMVGHLAVVLPRLPDNPVQAVRMIATLPSEDGTRFSTHLSFASKLAHFFVSPDRFPILDVFAERMVAYHLGRELSMRSDDRYGDFYANINRLRELSGLQASYRELDRYLWLAGQYRDWLEDSEEAVVNPELRWLFEDQDPEVQRLLGELWPEWEST